MTNKRIAYIFVWLSSILLAVSLGLSAWFYAFWACVCVFMSLKIYWSQK